MYPEAYDVKLLSNEYYIFMHDVTSQINLSKLKIHYDIHELFIDKIQKKNSCYIEPNMQLFKCL